MVRIRLRRVGKKKQPSFRLVAADKESPRDGRFLENLGFYNPRTEPATIKLKEDRIFDWMSKGAQPSDAAENIMRVAGTLERYERFKAGEDIEKLLEEAAAGDAARNINPKTRRDPPMGKPNIKPKAEEAPVKEAAVAEEPADAAAEEPKAEEEPTDVAVEEPKVEEQEETKAEEKGKEEAQAEEPADKKAEEKAPAKKEATDAAAEEPKTEKQEEAKAEEDPAEEAADKPKTKAPAKKKAEEEAPAVTSSRASVEKLELPANITDVLVEGGFKTVGKLAKQMESDTQPLLDLSGIGPKAIETIDEKLKAFQP